MFIEKGSENEIPEGAIRLSRQEVFEYMTDLIRKWPDTYELWALKYGNPILSSAVVISNTVILNFYRNRLKLKNYGRFTLFIPIVMIPSIYDQLYQNTVTMKSVILQDDCPLCITTQSTFIQLGTGIVYPLMSSIGGCYMFAHKMGTFYLNSNRSNIVKEFLNHLVRLSGPIYNRLTVFVIGHALLSYGITNYQMKNLEFLRLKMYEQHEEEVQQRLQSRSSTKNMSLNN